MAEYIGSRISLISKRDIRYVGTLHEISSENSTVALEQVVSFGTEDRNATPGEFVPPSDNVYEYIVFRGSDVKDLRIEKEPEKKPPQAPQIPDDPAILGKSRPAGSGPASAGKQDEKAVQEPGTRQPQQPPPFHEQQAPPPQQYGQQWMNNYPPNQRFGPRDAPGFPPYGHPGMHYGPPPGWYGPPDRGFPQGHPGQFQPPHHMQQGPFPPHQGGPQHPPSKPNTPAEVMASQPPPKPTAASEKQAATVKLPGSTIPSGPVPAGDAAPPPPAESKPDVAAALAPPTGTGPVATANNSGAAKGAPAITKSGRIQPAVPILAGQKPKAPVNGTGPSKASEAKAKPSGVAPAQASAKSYEDANADARAAVAAAMANLAPSQSLGKQTNGDAGAADNLTKKFNEMRTDDYATAARAASGVYGSGHRGGRGLHRGGRPRTESHGKKIEVPKTDYDFATANAKFNKQDLLKEASTGGSPSAGTPAESVTNDAAAADGPSQDQVVIPPPVYNKTASFFDNISSESRDREDTAAKKLGGREFRSEETKKNLETFGQGSVDGRRGGFRGRGRGRGGRGGRGRGAFRGRGDAVVTEI